MRSVSVRTEASEKRLQHRWELLRVFHKDFVAAIQQRLPGTREWQANYSGTIGRSMCEGYRVECRTLW